MYFYLSEGEKILNNTVKVSKINDSFTGSFFQS